MSQSPGRRNRFITIAGLLLVAGAIGAAGACSASGEDAVDSEELQGAPEDNNFALTQEVAAGATLRTTANLNLRKGPSTSDSIIRVIPQGSTVKAVDGVPQGSFYKIDHNGTVGWSSGQYLEVVSDGGVLGSIPAGSSLEATADVNLRAGPATSYSILEVVATGSVVTVVEPNPENDFYRIDHNGTVGWSSGKYYKAASGDGGGGSSVRDEAINRAKSAMGFSYWWGHGRYKVEGPTSSTAGSCSGSCPSCSHSGSYGGDCSGLAAKVWQVPSSNTDLSTDSHPYSTGTFVASSSQWSTISRDSVKKGDALVYNNSGAGHIFIYSSGDAWGTLYSYECKGCAAGCVYGSRTAGSTYKAIRKTGW
jgi:uncharacterized protein YraI